MGLNDRGNDNQTFGSTWTVETNVSSNPEELSSRGIGLHSKFDKNINNYTYSIFYKDVVSNVIYIYNNLSNDVRYPKIIL